MAIPALRLLYDIIGTSLSTIETVYSDAKEMYPYLDDIYVYDSPAEQLLYHAEVAKAASLITAAAEQMMASLKPPYNALFDSVLVYQLPACIAYVERLNIVEALNTAGTSGVCLDDLARMIEGNPGKLGWFSSIYLLRSAV